MGAGTSSNNIRGGNMSVCPYGRTDVRTDVRTYVRTDIFPPLILLGRLLEVDLNIHDDIISVLATSANNFVPARQKHFYKFWLDEELSALKEAAVESNRLKSIR